MKRLIAFLILSLLLLTACGKNTVNIPDRPEEPATLSSSAEKDAVTLPQESTTELPTEETATSAQATTTVPQAPTEELAATTPATTRASEENRSTTQAPNTTAPVTAAPTTAPVTQPQAEVCYVRIECGTIYDNLKKLKAGKAAFVPESGVILENAAVTLQEGDTAFSVLKRACAEHVCTDNCRYCQKEGIQLEYTFTPVFETYYIEGIHQIYEKDCGSMSGWMFSVNGSFPEEGASSTAVSAGDRIVFCFTCDMGDDVGNHFEG